MNKSEREENDKMFQRKLSTRKNEAYWYRIDTAKLRQEKRIAAKEEAKRNAPATAAYKKRLETELLANQQKEKLPENSNEHLKDFINKSAATRKAEFLLRFKNKKDAEQYLLDKAAAPALKKRL